MRFNIQYDDCMTSHPTYPLLSTDGHVRQQQKQWSRNGMWNPSHPGLGLTQSSYYSTKEAEKVPLDTDKVLEAEKAPATEKVEEVENIQEAEDKDPEEPLHTIIQDTENVQGDMFSDLRPVS